MASNYAGFPVQVISDTTGPVSVGSGVDVIVEEDDGTPIAESPLTTNGDGEIVADSFASVTVGTKVIFRVEDFEGGAGSIAQITT